jgi:hypothetical protein
MPTPRVFADAVLFTTTTTGTGTLSVGNAVDGYFAPADVSGLNGSRVPYVIVDSLTAPTKREHGEGVLATGTPWTMTRATIRASLSGGVAGASAINWAAGTKYVFLSPSAATLAALDMDGGLKAMNAPKAWVVHSGSAISDSYGVASVTDNGVGDLTVNFEIAFTSANYAIIGTVSLLASDGAITTIQPRSDTSQIAAGSCRLNCSYDASASGRTLVDAAYMCAAFFGDQ